LLCIFAVLASIFHLALCLPQPATVGDVLEDMLQAAQAQQLGVAISRHDYLRQEVRMALEEGEAVDLLAMGRPEGQGCYCAVNHLLRQVVDELGGSYAYVVIDNEAGMEHISRRTTKDVDLLLVVTDPTVRGLKTAVSIAQMAKDVEVNVKHTLLVVNRVEGELPPELQQAIEQSGLELAAMIPADDAVNALDARGEALVKLDVDSPAGQAIDDLARRIQTLI